MTKAKRGLSAQEAFNKIVRHLFRQGKQCIDENVIGAKCVYRKNRKAGDKMRCAIGSIIPDDKYDSGFEFISIGKVINKIPNVFERIFPDDKYKRINFLYKMQNTHDNSYNWSSKAEMKNALEGIAVEYGLNTKALDKISGEGHF